MGRPTHGRENTFVCFGQTRLCHAARFEHHPHLHQCAPLPLSARHETLLRPAASGPRRATASLTARPRTHRRNPAEAAHAGSSPSTPALVLPDCGRGDDASLRRAAVGGPVAPVLAVSGPKQVFDKPQKAVVVDLLSEDRQQDLVVDVVERPIKLLPPSRTRRERA